MFCKPAGLAPVAPEAIEQTIGAFSLKIPVPGPDRGGLRFVLLRYLKYEIAQILDLATVLEAPATPLRWRLQL